MNKIKHFDFIREILFNEIKSSIEITYFTWLLLKPVLGPF